MNPKAVGSGVPDAPKKRILGMDRDVAFWVFAILGLFILGFLLDLFWGSL
jgi:hypothetical protein